MNWFLRAIAMLIFVTRLPAATLTTGVDVQCSADEGLVISHSNPCDVVGTMPDPFTGELPFARAAASANAAYGLLNINVSFAADHGGFAEVDAFAAFLDDITILGSGAAIFEITAVSEEDSTSNTGTTATLTVGSEEGVRPIFGATTMVFSAPIMLGQPFGMGARLDARALASDNDDTPPQFPLTLTIEQIRVLNEAGQQLSGLRYRSETGAGYPIADASYVPEPSAAILAGCGLGILVIGARRRRAHRASSG
jgi:hypothetical protein